MRSYLSLEEPYLRWQAFTVSCSGWGTNCRLLIVQNLSKPTQEERMLIHRRSLLLGMGSLLVSPPIVRATSIMPVKTMIWDGRVPVTIFNHGVNAGLGSYLTHAIQVVGPVDAWGGGSWEGVKYWQIWDPYRKRYRTVTSNRLYPFEGRLYPFEGPLPTFLVDYGPASEALCEVPTITNHLTL